MTALADFLALRPMGGFNLIMADPPWRFENYSAKGEEKNASAHYDCMDLDVIAALPVAALAAQDALLWLWATHPMLPEALAVMAAWGFTYKSGGVWCKRTVHGKDSFGTGYTFRNSSEPILIGTRGNPKTARDIRSTVATYGGAFAAEPGDTWPDTVVTIEAPVREHSRKPDIAFETAERLVPACRPLELFSRQSRRGWASWGDQAGLFDGAVA